MDLGNSLFKMGNLMKDFTRMTKNMDMEDMKGGG